jgi:hypothetical protein
MIRYFYTSRDRNFRAEIGNFSLQSKLQWCIWLNSACIPLVSLRTAVGSIGKPLDAFRCQSQNCSCNLKVFESSHTLKEESYLFIMKNEPLEEY